MNGSKNQTGSAGVLESLRQNKEKDPENVEQGKKEKKQKSIPRAKNESDAKDKKMTRTYSLPHETIKKLQELQLYHYNANTRISDIVNEAITNLYEEKNQ